MAVAPPRPLHQRPSPSTGITRNSSTSPLGSGHRPVRPFASKLMPRPDRAGRLPHTLRAARGDAHAHDASRLDRRDRPRYAADARRRPATPRSGPRRSARTRRAAIPGSPRPAARGPGLHARVGTPHGSSLGLHGCLLEGSARRQIAVIVDRDLREGRRSKPTRARRQGVQPGCSVTSSRLTSTAVLRGTTARPRASRCAFVNAAPNRRISDE